MSMRSASHRASLEAATTRYQTHLYRAEQFLAARGFTEPVAISRRFGVVIDPFPEHSDNIGRLSIPYLTPNGVVKMKFRCLLPHDCKAVGCRKYTNVTGEEHKLYGVNAFAQARHHIAVTEGELDQVILNDLVGIPAIGAPGVDSWKKHWNRCFDDFQVFVFADGDDAGRRFALQLVRELQAVTVQMPDGLDVNDAFLKFGADWFHEQIGNVA